MATATLDLRQVAGRFILNGTSQVGRFTYFVGETLRALPEVRIWWPRFIEEAWNIGVGSMFLVLLIAVFAGAVTALQAGYQFTGSLPYYIVGTLVVSAVILELGPVLTALVLAGRIGARYAAQLGTMRVTEQIDALESLGRSPYSHLVVPRVLAALVMIPMMTILANTAGILAGWWSVKLVLPVTDMDFVYGAQYFFRPFDLWYSLIKSEVFGIVVTLIPCYVGFSAESGAEGVGRATTKAVVVASVAILVLDTVLAKILLPS